MQELHQLLSLIQSSDILVAIKSIDPYLGKEFMGIGYDKYLHGALAFSIMWVFFGLLKRDLLSSVEIVVTLSVMKEIFDLFVKQTFFSYGDLVADTIGILIFVIIAHRTRTKMIKI